MELVATMHNENSGTPAKLRTYGSMRAHEASVASSPHNGGGITFDLSAPTMGADKHVDGYYVGGLMENLNIPAHASVKRFQFAIGYIWGKTDGRGLAGFWYNPETDTVEAEASEWIESRTEALSLAERRGETAIYDVAGKVSVYL